KLAKYLQGKYEKPILQHVPLIGGATPSQFLGSALGIGEDFALMRGPIGGMEKGMGGAAEAARPVVAAAARLGQRATLSGGLGVVRGAVISGANALAGAAKAPMEGAIDFSHG